MPGEQGSYRPFQTPWWLNSPHLQTLWQPLFRRLPEISRKRERLETPDGDFIDLDWYGPSDRPTVIMLHGLSGSSQSAYIIGMQAHLAKEGFCTVAMNFRGCSGEPNRTWRIYHSGETSDLSWVIQKIRSRVGTTPLFCIGFSLGGNVLLKYLGEQAQNALIDRAAAVSVPLRLDLCANRLDRGFSTVYRDRLIRELNDYLDLKYRHLRKIGRSQDAKKLEALGTLNGIRSFWDYDQRVVAPLYGFKDAGDYYRKSSSAAYLEMIGRPTLIIQAKDDPFMEKEALEKIEAFSQKVILEVTREGGHVGFVEGSWPLRPRYWIEGRLSRWLAQGLIQSSQSV